MIEIKKKRQDICLYKYRIIKGKESIADEWLEFLKAHKEDGERLLKKEKAYLEAYFKSVENEMTYIYMLFSSDSISFSNSNASEEGTELDKKHFDYMKACIDLNSIKVLSPELFLNNVEDSVEVIER